MPSSSQHWPAREDQDTNSEAEAATFEDKEVNADPAISHKDVGTVDEPDEPDKAVNIKRAISHKNAGTRRIYIRL